MVATTALLVGGGLAAAIGLAMASKAKAAGNRGKATNVDPLLFETGPDGTVAFKPAVSAGFLNTALTVSAFEFPEQGNDDLIMLTKAAVSPQPVARTWIIDRNVNENLTILAVRHLTVPTAPPPNGPMRLMMAVAPGTENLLTKGNSLWAVFALAGTLAPGAGAPDPSDLPIPPPGALPEPGEILPGELPDIPVVIPPTPSGGMPAGLQAEFDRVFNESNDPDELRAVAAILEANGFPAEAQALRTKAAAIEAQQAIIDAAPRQILIGNNGLPLPGNVAIHYTGSIARFKELADPVNPGVHVVPVPGMPGQFGLSPWAGQTITIPNNWPHKATAPSGALPVGSNPFDVPGGGQSVPPGGVTDVDFGDPFGGVLDSFGQFDDFFDPDNEPIV